MENYIMKSSLKTREEVVSDLKTLVQLVNDGKEGYQHAADKTESPELKAVFLKLSGERIVYAAELKAHIATHGGEAENEDGGILGSLHRGWITIKEAITGNDDKALIEAIQTGEKAAIAKYDEYISDYADHADHLELLKSQREGIETALKEIETLKKAIKV
ncbi:ferritin-like domain-containing protein [Mucilaginibacter jinjuensis]|uniref:PA2169 family four-helix-bundle protein n=1 Tax=Mucilaginibacter jinjuensis TaxID=1176721 RepID=A0ABY7TF11_9SPHI|nr:PA2169 family four-helix-bundle protein [Mucilaginibacter jinjuensis]WCT13762.1 PA2169 family four-helix-bundle protein [Mucilaginibacter jinjuensis]